MQPLEVRNQRIIIGCLNWGKGHVSRSIGLINQLLCQENEIFIASDSEQREVFKCYFPDIIYLELSSYPFSFSGKGNFSHDLWKSRKGILSTIRIEKIQLDHYIEKLNITLVISDHRYGFYSSNVSSIFVTHQLNLPLKWWQKPVQWWHNSQLKKFKQIWVMDSKDSFLAGKLSQNLRWDNVEFIGYYSRFMYQRRMNETSQYMEVVICSGPPPHDEQLLLQYLDDPSKKIICSSQLAKKYTGTNVLSASNWLEIDELILNADIIYSYSGYSTLMDLHFLRCNSFLKATVGQAEQEYLMQIHLNWKSKQ